MGTPAYEVIEEPLTLKRGDIVNEWIIDNQILSIGYMSSNRAWQAHCSFCGWQRVLHEVTLSDGYIPRCINACGASTTVNASACRSFMNCLYPCSLK